MFEISVRTMTGMQNKHASQGMLSSVVRTGNVVLVIQHGDEFLRACDPNATIDVNADTQLSDPGMSKI